jgi:hypothetical protein
LRLDKVQHHLRRHRRVNRAAARAEDLQARRRRVRVGRDDHLLLRPHHRLLGPAGADLGRRLRRRRDGNEDEKGERSKHRGFRWFAHGKRAYRDATCGGMKTAVP